ncbi:MAG: HEPN domain-containing protein [Moorellales bacterium]
MEQAEYDFSAAEAMFKARKYIYCVFMIQLALEKALKAGVRTKDGPGSTENSQAGLSGGACAGSAN